MLIDVLIKVRELYMSVAAAAGSFGLSAFVN